MKKRAVAATLALPFAVWWLTRTPSNQRGQNNNAPDLEPVKLFDNLYALGNSETAVYAITTSEGIVLIDSGPISVST